MKNWTDAIAGMSSGTTIKYIDTQTNTTLNITSNILGAMITQSVGSSSIGFVYAKYGSSSTIFYSITISTQSPTIDYDSKYNIRVFYF